MQNWDSREDRLQVENVSFSILINRQPPSFVPPEERPPQENFLLLHTHAFPELFLCTTGHICIQTQEKDVVLEAGELLLVPAGIIHRKSPEDAPAEWRSVCFSFFPLHQDKTHNFYRELELLCQRSEVLLFKNRAALCRELYLLLDPAENNPYAAIPGVRAMHLLEILLRLQGESKQRPRPSPPPPSTPGRDVCRLLQLENFLSVSFAEDIHPADAARLLCISTRHLNRILHERYGVSFRQALTQLRLQAACGLLRDTDKSANEIGAMVGFSSAGGFARAFRQAYGTSPKKMRQQKAENEKTDRKD